MSGDIIQLSVGSDRPVPVEPVDGVAVVTVGSGDTVYYSDHLAVSATGNQGSIASGASQTFTSNAWIISAGRSAVRIVTGSATGLVPSGAQDVIVGSDGKVGGPGGTGLTSSVVTAPSDSVSGAVTGAQQVLWADQARRLQRRAQALYGNARVSTPAVISLRVDSFNGPDFTVVKPLLDSNGLVACLPGSIYQAGDVAHGFMSWAQIYQLQSEGHEIQMKGFSDPAVNGGWSFFLSDIAAHLSGFAAQNIGIDAAAQQGLWTDAFNFDTAAKLDGTDIGRTFEANVMALDAYVADDYYGGFRSFPIVRKYGGTHYSATDLTTLAAAQAPITAAIAAGAYVQVLIHSADLDTGGHLSTANLTALLAWIAGLRDQGLVTVMTGTAAKYAQRGQEINLVQDYSFTAAATVPANSDWTLNGSPNFGAAGSAHSRGGNRTIIPAYPSGYVFKQLPAGNLRTLEFSCWAQSSTGSNTTARLLIKQTLPDGSTLVINRDVQWALTGSTWRKLRAFVRPDPRGGSVVFDLFAVGAGNPPAYSDVLIKAS